MFPVFILIFNNINPISGLINEADFIIDLNAKIEVDYKCDYSFLFIVDKRNNTGNYCRIIMKLMSVYILRLQKYNSPNVCLQLLHSIAAIAVTLHKAKLLKNLAAIDCICSYTIQRTFGEHVALFVPYLKHNIMFEVCILQKTH